MTQIQRPVNVGLLGFGEAASTFVSGWNKSAIAALTAFDLKIEAPESKPALMAFSAQHGVTAALNHQSAFDKADIVFSLVFADQALDAATRTAAVIRKGTLFIDGNSCSPQTKTRAAGVIASAGGRYVDMAVMAPVHPKREKTPVLVSGPDAEDAAAILARLGMVPKISGAQIGQASAIKLTRSIMIKGMEALFAECMLAARLGGVEDDVLRSFEASDPDIDWRKRAAYSLDRMTTHGRRRAAEMREAANMVRELGLPNDMSAATAKWQQLLGDLPIQTSDIAAVIDAMDKP